MRTLDRGRIVKIVKPYPNAEGETPPVGAIARVLAPGGRDLVLIQLPPGTPGFRGHSGDDSVRTRAWYIPRSYVKPTREKVSSAREFAARFGA